ncbi:MAG: hypothetical protein NWF06_10715 [Candidatus Bathyarchaeota archaeon]|nr:hypothetical protein [Candidatus Bathyarchaeum sp.]
MPTETILQLLENGKWHYLKDMPEKTRLTSFTVEAVTNFLVNYNFVKFDASKQKIRLDSPANKFFKRFRQLETVENL